MKIIFEQLGFAKETVSGYLKRKQEKAGDHAKLGGTKKKITKAEKTFVMQCVVSVLAFALGGFLLVASYFEKDSKFAEFGIGLICTVLGYWLR